MICSRTVLISDTPSLLRGRRITPSLPCWPTKDPAERLTYTADFAAVLPAAATIAQVDTPVDPPGSATVHAAEPAGSAIVMDISGGTAGVTATVTVVLTLAGGGRIARGIMLPIAALGVVPPVPVGDLTVNGLPLTLGGAPVLATVPALTVAASPITVGPVSLTVGDS